MPNGSLLTSYVLFPNKCAHASPNKFSVPGTNPMHTQQPTNELIGTIQCTCSDPPLSPRARSLSTITEHHR
eukprot:1161745-Pelagomonas_calceolata.AAC.11